MHQLLSNLAWLFHPLSLCSRFANSESKADVDEFVEYQLYFISTVFLSLPTLKKSEKEITPKII